MNEHTTLNDEGIDQALEERKARAAEFWAKVDSRPPKPNWSDKIDLAPIRR